MVSMQEKREKVREPGEGGERDPWGNEVEEEFTAALGLYRQALSMQQIYLLLLKACSPSTGDTLLCTHEVVGALCTHSAPHMGVGQILLQRSTIACAHYIIFPLFPTALTSLQRRKSHLILSPWVMFLLSSIFNRVREIKQRPRSVNQKMNIFSSVYLRFSS